MNNGESSVFRISLNRFICIVVLWLYNTFILNEKQTKLEYPNHFRSTHPRNSLWYPSNHHHVVPPARISLTLSLHFSLSYIVFGRSSGLHSVSSQSCSMYVRAGRPTFARPHVGVHRSTSLMSSSFLLKQCPACQVRLEFELSVLNYTTFNIFLLYCQNHYNSTYIYISSSSCRASLMSSSLLLQQCPVCLVRLTWIV